MAASRKRILAVLGVLVVCVAVAAAIVMHFLRTPIPDRATLNDQPQLQAVYDKAREYDQKIKANSSEIQNYVVVGNSWKMIGDFTHNPAWYRLSLDAYQRGIAATKQKNSLLLMNAGQVAEELNDFDTAKKYYLMSIDLSPGDATYYLTYIKLLKNKFHASTQEILRVYDDGMSRVIGGADLVSSREQFLKSVGRFKDARADLELLYKNKIITTQQYQDELADIQQLEAAHK